MCVYYCRTYYKAARVGGVEDCLFVYYCSACYKALLLLQYRGHVLRETTSRCVPGLVCVYYCRTYYKAVRVRVFITQPLETVQIPLLFRLPTVGNMKHLLLKVLVWFCSNLLVEFENKQ